MFTEGKISIKHVKHSNPKGPHIDLKAILLRNIDFRTHIVAGAEHSFPFLLTLAETKISNFISLR